MNFMQWLNSLDELLFEVMSWIVFFPITLWRTIRHPLRSMEYAEAQLARPDEEQYRDTLSPPIFLVLALFVAHALELATGAQSAIVGSDRGLAALVDDDRSLLLLRIILFGSFPLIMSTRLVRKQKRVLDRASLKPPFFAQCYLAAPFALVVSLGATLSVAHAPTGGLIICLAALAYWITEAMWFSRQLGRSFWRGFLYASQGMLEGLLVAIVVGYTFTR